MDNVWILYLGNFCDISLKKLELLGQLLGWFPYNPNESSEVAKSEVVMKFARIYYWILSNIAVKKTTKWKFEQTQIMWQTLLSYHLGMIFTMNLWNYWGSFIGFTRLIYKLGISNRQWWRVSSRTHSNSTSDMLECVCYTCA